MNILHKLRKSGLSGPLKMVLIYALLFVVIGECFLRIVGGARQVVIELKKKKYTPEEYARMEWKRHNANVIMVARKFNPVWFWDFVPNSTNGEGDVRINSLGFRGPDVPLAKDKGLRIVCIGGSTTYEGYLKEETTYPSLLQSHLAAAKNRHIDVINAGYPSFHLWQLIALYDEKIKPLKPDVVILYSGWNDLFSLSRDEVINHNFTKRKTANSLTFFLLNKSYLYSLFLKLTMAAQYRSLKAVPVHIAKEFVPNRFIRDYLTMIKKIKSDKDVRLILCTLPSSLGGDYRGYYDSNQTGEMDSVTYMYFVYNTIIRNIAREQNIEMVDLADIDALSKKDHYMPGDYCHFNELGSAVIAKALSKRILN